MVKRVLIAGSSMSPTLDVGDVALVRLERRVRWGDVIAFKTEEAPIVHRAIVVVPWPGNAFIVHKGDRRHAGYGTTRTSAVIGRVVAFERLGHRVELGARRPRLAEVGRALLKLFSVTSRVVMRRVSAAEIG